MKFERRTADDRFGTNELVLCQDDDTPTVITIADAREDGDGFVVYWGDDEEGRAETLDEAKRIALGIAGAIDKPTGSV
jgi:hypothetical protein